MNPAFRVRGILLAALALTACQRSRPETSGPVGAATTVASSANRPLTFNRDIAPILFEHCGSCHRPIEPAPPVARGTAPAPSASPNEPLCVAGAPFSLLEYRDVRDHARQVASATRNRTMPPWQPEPGYGAFAHERRLRDDQIAMIQQWVEQGSPEGDSAEKPRIPKWPEGWQLGTPDLVLNMQEPYALQAVGTDVFRNFVIPIPVASTRYVRAMEFRADNSTVLHHASVGIDRTRFSRTLDRADAGPGFAAMPDDRVENVFGWSPGKAPFMEPADMAWTLEKGSDLVMQLHMLPNGRREVIQPVIGLFFTDTPPTRVPLPIKLESKSIDIPAGEANYEVEDRYVLPADIDVVSIYPHAHYLAKEMKGLATLPDGTTKWLIWIKQWKFRWQDQYRYAAPLFLPKGTTISMHVTYDNSAANPSNPRHPPQRVKWGPQSTDEMGALWLEVLPRRRRDADVLVRDDRARSLRADIAGAQMQVHQAPNDPLAHNFLATRYLQAGLVAQAITELEAALSLKPDAAEAHSNLGSAFQLQGRLDEALQHLQEAARLQPNDDRVRFNLGNALNAAGRGEEAIRELGLAVQINPDNADAHFNLAVLIGPRNQLDEAVAHLRRAIEINPQYGEAHRNLAVALGLQGRLDEAIQEARAALRIQPGSAAARQQLDQLLQAKARR